MEDCSICYLTIDASSGHCTLSCKHTFHVQCFVKWSSKNASCPLCRKEVKGIEEKEEEPAILPMTFRYVTRLMSMVNLGDICVPEDDITFIMDQCNVTRGQACNALRDFDGDVVDAITFLREFPAEGPVRGPTNFDVPTPEQTAFWGLRALFDPQPITQPLRILRWRGGRGSTGGRAHESVHWKHLEGKLVLDMDGYDTD